MVDEQISHPRLVIRAAYLLRARRRSHHSNALWRIKFTSSSSRFFFHSFAFICPQTVGFCQELIDCREKEKKQNLSPFITYRPVWRLIKIHSPFVPLIFALLIIFLSINFFPSPLRIFFFFFQKLYFVSRRPSLLIYYEKWKKKKKIPIFSCYTR